MGIRQQVVNFGSAKMWPTYGVAFERYLELRTAFDVVLGAVGDGQEDGTAVAPFCRNGVSAQPNRHVKLRAASHSFRVAVQRITSLKSRRSREVPPGRRDLPNRSRS